MEVRLLTEATSVDDDDWMYVQKPNGLPRKVKKINLVPQVQQQPQQIIASTTPPENPQLGIMWNELDNNSDLIDSWTWISNRWQSPTKRDFKRLVTARVSVNQFIVLPASRNYNYLFTEFILGILPSQAVNWGTSSWTNVFSFRGIELFRFNSQINSACYTVKTNIFQQTDDNDGNYFTFFQQSNGTPPSIYPFFEISYYLIRK